jgi:hypothetical protein
MGRHPAGIDGDYRSAVGRLVMRQRLAALRGAMAVLLAALAAALSVIHLLYTLLERWQPLPLLSFCIFWSAAASAIGYAFRKQLPPFLRGARVTGDVDRADDLEGLLTSAWEFSGRGARLEHYSPYLRTETVRRALERIRASDTASSFRDIGRPAWGTAGLAAALLLLAQVSLGGRHGGSILAAVADPGLYFRARGRSNLVVTSGDMTILSGGEAVCEAVDFGKRAAEVSLLVSSVPGVWKGADIEIDTLDTEGTALRVFRRRFTDVRESFGYRFEAGGERSRERTVTVIHRPVINSIGARITPPRYTRIPPEEEHALAGRTFVPLGSDIALTGETSKEISGGKLGFASGKERPLAPAPGGFTVSFTAEADDTFLVEIVDTMGLSNENAILYPITVLEDQGPAIEILLPGDGAHVPLSMEVDLAYHASDDYGISRIRIHAMRSGKDEDFRTADLALPAGGSRKEIEAAQRWSLEELRLFPGDEVLYFLEAFDNNAVTGPSAARTETRRIAVPTLADMYERISEEEEMRREGLAAVLEESGEVRMRLKELSDELKARGEFDWSRRRESLELLEKHEELTEKIGEAADGLDRTLEALERNNATSQEIGEKLHEIQELLSRVESEELRAAMERFRRMLDEVDDDALAEAMRRVEIDMDEFMQRLDRAVELLRQVMIEERLEEFVRRAEEMLEQQRDIRDSEGDADELARRQQRLAEEMSALEKDMADLAREESGSRFGEGLGEALDEAKNSAIERSMIEAASRLSGGDTAGARSLQQDAMDGLLSLYTSLARFQFGIQMAMDAEALQELSRSAGRLIEISKEQEALANDVERAGGIELPAAYIERQAVLREAIRSVREKLYEAARKTMAVPGAVFYHIERALAASEMVLDAAGDRNGPAAVSHAGRVYEGLNTAAIELLRSCGSAGSCGGQGGADGMQMLMGGQFSLDQQLREMLQEGSAGKWTMEERAGMARLAAEQRKIEEMLERVLEESRGTGELLGRLDDVGGEMAEVADLLERGALDERLLEREERILSRMLESQRSLARRDYKRERISRTAGDVGAVPLAWAPESEGAAELVLETIRRSMRQKGPAEFEELNRFYFRALSRKVREKEQ